MAAPGPSDIQDCVEHLFEHWHLNTFLKCVYRKGAAGWRGYIVAIAYRVEGGKVHVQRELVTYDLGAGPQIVTLQWRAVWNLCLRVEGEGTVVMTPEDFALLFLP